MRTIESVLAEIQSNRDACDAATKIIRDLRDDPCFVIFQADPEDEAGLEEVNEWFFENDIVRKFETIIMGDVPGMGAFAVNGFRFRNTESAMAFKLKWT